MHSTVSAAQTSGSIGMLQLEMSAIAAGKMRTASVDSHFAFHQQQSPYACPPHSIQSSINFPSTATSPGPSSILTGKEATFTSACVKNNLYKKLSDFTQESKGCFKDKDNQHTHHIMLQN